MNGSHSSHRFRASGTIPEPVHGSMVPTPIGGNQNRNHTGNRAGRTNEGLDSRRWHVNKAERDDLPLLPFDTGQP